MKPEALPVKVHMKMVQKETQAVVNMKPYSLDSEMGSEWESRFLGAGLLIHDHQESANSESVQNTNQKPSYTSDG